jgi:Na+:H+ antiporter, NhaA family
MMVERTIPPIQPRPIARFLQPFSRFTAMEAAGGLLLLIATLVAILVANSPWGSWYSKFLHLPFAIALAGEQLDGSLHFWINDGCMTLFFLLVGLEIKRELVSGELSTIRRAMFPMLAAIGGVIVPALIYIAFNHSQTTVHGWGIPMATDIAFSLAILAAFGKRIPTGLKVFLTAFAIADDIAGVVVIATVYTDTLKLSMLLIAALCLGACLLANLAGVIRLRVYLLLGALLWFALLKSGVHATLAGLMIALAVPAHSFIEPGAFLTRGRIRLLEFERAAETEQVGAAIRDPLHRLRAGLELVESPLDRLEHRLHPWVSFGIVPLFAFANAGIDIREIHRSDLIHPAFLGIYFGLLLGKPLGISLFSWLAVRLRIARLPYDISWPQLHAVSWLGGIGFTISIFIANLAFDNSASFSVARLGILMASTSSAIIGSLLLLRTTRTS